VSERELRHELERLQAEARALKDELAAPHAPGFVERRDALKARKATVDAEVQKLEAAHADARTRLDTVLAAVKDTREALRAAEQRRLTWEPWLVLPVVLVGGSRVLGEDALRLPGGAFAALGLGLLFGHRALRSVLPNAPKVAETEPRVPVTGSTGIAAFVVALLAVLLGGPEFLAWWEQGRPSTGGITFPGLALSLTGLMMAVRGAGRARELKLSGWWLSVAAGAACGLLLLALDVVALVGAIAPPGYSLAPASQLARLAGLVGAVLWVPLAAWSVADRFWAPARRFAVGLSLAFAGGALVTCAAVARVGLAPQWESDVPVQHFTPVGLVLQLAVYGAALGVRGARAPGARKWLRWSGVVANLLALGGLYVALQGSSLLPW
jgi:hypothetical protein